LHETEEKKDACFTSWTIPNPSEPGMRSLFELTPGMRSVFELMEIRSVGLTGRRVMRTTT